jgi:hypothetical protein
MTVSSQRRTGTPRSRRRESDRAEARLRLRAGFVVAALLAGTLVAGGALHARPPRSAAVLQAGQLPVVDLASSAAVEWQCPGPLPAGASALHSSVIVANPGDQPAEVEAQVVAVSAGFANASSLPSYTTRLSVAPHSQGIVPLRTTGPLQHDAVSVLSMTGSVAVFESVAAVAAHTHVRRHVPSVPPMAPEQSPCATSPTSSSYLAAGSTTGRSDVVLSLFNPTATQAVAAVEVSTGSAVVSPPPLQGLIIKPYSLQVFDLARSVVQQGILAVTETTSVGRLVLGASETLAADATANIAISGQALLIGVATPQDTWVMPAGLAQPGRSVSMSVYDPGRRPATVTISCAVAGHSLVEITDTVSAGGVREILLPFPAATSSASKSKAPSLPVDGPIVVRTAQGVGVVVARVATRRVSAHAETVALSVGTANPADDWLLPASSPPATAQTPGIAGGIVVSNPSPSGVQVEVLQLTTAGGSGPSQVATVTVAPDSSATVKFRLLAPAGGPSFAGLEVRASSTVVVEQDFFAVAGTSGPALDVPAPVQGIPVTR